MKQCFKIFYVRHETWLWLNTTDTSITIQNNCHFGLELIEVSIIFEYHLNHIHIDVYSSVNVFILAHSIVYNAYRFLFFFSFFFVFIWVNELYRYRLICDDTFMRYIDIYSKNKNKKYYEQPTIITIQQLVV